MERFWNPETLDTKTHGWTEMNVNMLTKADAPFNDVVGTYTLRGFQVKVYPCDEPPKGIWQNPRDFISWLSQPSDATPQVTDLKVMLHEDEKRKRRGSELEAGRRQGGRV